MSLASYDALPLIGQAAVAAYAGAGRDARPSGFDAAVFFGFRGTFQGGEITLLELKARQMAWAVVRTQALWLRAWREAASGGIAPGALNAKGPRR